MYKSNHLKTTSFFALSALTIALFSNYSYAEETPQAPAEDPVPQETAPEQSADNCLDGVVINQ